MIKKFKKQSKNTQRGFTLIETFIAITILMLAVVGPLTIAQKSLDAAIYSRDDVTAYYLAQDAIEYVIQLRDIDCQNAAPSCLDGVTGLPNDWIYGIPALCIGGTCKVDTTVPYTVPPSGGSGGLATCVVSTTCILNYNTVTELYGYSSGGTWITSPFTRTITFTADSAHELTIAVTVSWRSGLFTAVKSYTVYQHLFNWQ